MLDLRSQVPTIIENTEEEIVELNQEQLYLSGIDAEGNTLDHYRNPEYSEMKAAMNPNPGAGIPDLNLTGNFYRGFEVSVTKDEFILSSTDPKTEWLEERYGEKIFGFTRDSRKRYALGVFYNAVKLYITQVTGLKFK